jgi:hypothetical protein
MGTAATRTNQGNVRRQVSARSFGRPLSETRVESGSGEGGVPDGVTVRSEAGQAEARTEDPEANWPTGAGSNSPVTTTEISYVEEGWCFGERCAVFQELKWGRRADFLVTPHPNTAPSRCERYFRFAAR